MMQRKSQDIQRLIKRRTVILSGAKVTLFGLLMGRLYYLQVVESEGYKTLAENNRFNLELLPPTRGRILDRNDVPLATNKDNFRIEIVSEQTKDVSKTLEILQQVVTIGHSDIRRVMEQIKRKRGFVPVPVVDNLSRSDIARVAIHAPYLPGIKIEVGQTRYYPFADSAVHLTGYVAAVSQAELTGDPLLELPDFRVGKSGIEKAYDQKMRGAATQRQVEVNALGRIIRKLPGDDGSAGEDVGITVDIRLQNFCARRLAQGNSTLVRVDDPRIQRALNEGQKLPRGTDSTNGQVNIDDKGRLVAPESGAVVVMDAFNGEILALTSTPGFNPNVFTEGLTATDWENLLSNPRSPMTNKAVSGQYSPGSTFKMIVCLAALEEGLAHRETKIDCPGFVEFGNSRFHCWKKHGHGRLDMIEAIEQSCDVYLYDLARRLGIKRIGAMARRFGFGEKFDFGLPGENKGLVPSPEWKRRSIGEPWHAGETLITSIGQGFILCTPVQLAVMTSRLVNGGRAITPRLLLGESKRLMESKSLNLSPKHLEVILEGMDRVLNSNLGTARKVPKANARFKFGGKSGSVQVKRISLVERESGKLKNKEKPWNERDHAMFVAFAPLDSPRYVTAVVVEHGGGGSTMAAPIARDILGETIKLNPSRVSDSFKFSRMFG
ncbi:MAG: penicillin-binding protein 2 [Rhodospirillaceae bacterium]|nr:penicillin-binding protein 2 [Rhodospirillaceae bacterium]